MSESNELHIALAFDERFWAPAYATMRSICLTTYRRTDLRFHLCHPGLREESLRTLDDITTEFGAVLIHHELDGDAEYQHFAATLPHTKYISAVAYARLLLGRLVDPSVERIVYLDSDFLIRAPVEELLAQDLKGRPMGGVRDPHRIVFSNGRDVKHNRDLLDPADPYFNSGLVVIDLPAWRRMDMAATLHRLQQDGTLPRLTHDQQILNYIFRNNWTEIDPSWNTLGLYQPIEMTEPKGVHFAGLDKPWNLLGFAPFRRGYRHVMTNAVFYRYMRERWARRLRGWIGLKD